MRAYFCGTRGSTPVSGADHLRYGGNTSCVALAHDGERPSLVLDAGTGLLELTKVLDGRPFQGSLLLGHLHWDHTHGLPFFRAGLMPDHRVDTYLPEQGCDPVELLSRVIAPPHFPILPPQLGSGWRFHNLDAGSCRLEGFDVRAEEIPHKGGRTFGFRVSDGASTVAYFSDHSPSSLGPGPDGLGEYHDAAVALASDADVLIHDAQHTAAELPEVAYLGHSAAEYAVGLAQRCGVATVVLFHHDPWRTDEQIDRIAAACSGSDVRVVAAFDGMVLDVPGLRVMPDGRRSARLA